MNRAFSLIEVLIAIVVLALGLLGIAAVFPAVLTQQRTTTDIIQGTSLERSVRDLIRAHRELNAPSYDSDRDGQLENNELRGWRLLVGNLAPGWSLPIFPEPLDPANAIHDGDFEIPGNVTTAAGLSIDTTNGDMYVVYPGAPTIYIPYTQRLLQATSGRALYAWDFAARRLSAGEVPGTNRFPEEAAYQDDSIQIAVFIRRTDTPGPRGSVVPIAEDANERPTFSGVGAYSRIKSAQATIEVPAIPVPGSVIRVQSPLARYLAQPNQKIVDAFGKVHQVVESSLNAAGTEAILTLRDKVNQGDLDALTNAGRPADTFGILFTTQVPASVSVFDIRPAPLTE
jgi:prepilin-type N-terminal cleavage/methylation domain-containing protein